MELIIAKFDEQMSWIKQHFPPNPDPKPEPISRIKETRSKGILPTTGNPIILSSNMVNLRGNKKNSSSLQSFFKNPKINLLRFSRDDVKGWVQLCYMFFMFNKIPDHRIVMYVAMYFDGLARSWFRFKFQSIEGLSWNQFHNALIARFSKEGHENVLTEVIKTI